MPRRRARPFGSVMARGGWPESLLRHLLFDSKSDDAQDLFDSGLPFVVDRTGEAEIEGFQDLLRGGALDREDEGKAEAFTIGAVQ